MALSMSQMWSIARGEQSFEMVKLQEDCTERAMTLEEAAMLFPLDEAYFGKKPVEKIQKAMDKVYAVVMANPQINLQNAPEARDLEKAFCDVFGVKSCSIYWSNQAGMGLGTKGPRTWPHVKMLHSEDAGLKYGTHSNGFYDKNHVMSMYISTDQTLFTEAGYTSAEMVAMLLHETGHNFDHSMWTLINDWMMICQNILDVITAQPGMVIPKAVGAAVGTGIGFAIKEKGRGVIQTLSNIDDMIMNCIPPIGTIMRMVGRVGFNFMKVLLAIFSPVTATLMIPPMILMTPFTHLANLYKRKGEVSADSFAASYGYSSEMVTALEKAEAYMYQQKDAEDSFLTPFYDLAMVQADILNMLMGLHGNTQQRAKRMMDKLDKDLERSTLSAADKAEIKKEKERLMATYDKFMNCDNQVQGALTKIFREMVDSWYAGKNYMFVPILERNTTYAE